MRAEDLWLICRYSPMKIDDTIYFVIAIGVPSGNLRRNKSQELVTYVDPRTGVEYTREKSDFLVRAVHADLNEVQHMLDYLRPHHYRAVQIMAGHIDAIPITMVVRSQPDTRGQCLPYQARELIKKYSAELDPHNPANSIAVAARLLKEHSATRFIRLSRILGGTIWSI